MPEFKCDCRRLNPLGVFAIRGAGPGPLTAVLIGGLTLLGMVFAAESPALAIVRPSPAPPLAIQDDGPADARLPIDVYEEKLAEWKSVIRELRGIMVAYQSCTREEADELARQWGIRVAEGDRLIQELKTVATDVYRSSPRASRDLIAFLVRMVEVDLQNDRYDSAYQIGSLLLENGVTASKLFNDVGVAAFATHHFGEAQNLLTNAVNVGVIEHRANSMLEMLAQFEESWPAEQEAQLRDAQQGDLPQVKLTTTKGEIIVELFEDDAPETVGNFINLVERGYYDGLKFHRVISGFMAQTGCPNGDGTGNPGYNIYSEFDKPTARRHFRGVLSMANTGEPNTGGSQFFITFLPTPYLDGKHTVFGRVVSGLDVLANIQRFDPEAPDPGLGELDSIVSAEVLFKRDHEYAPNRVPQF